MRNCDVKELDIGSFPALTTLAPTKPINTTNNDVISTSRAESSGGTVAKSPSLLETPKLDPGKLRSEAFDALKALEEAWLIDTDSEHTRTASPPRDQQEGAVEVEPPTKILSLLKTTVDAVRAVRAWSLAVPATSLLRSSAVIRQKDYSRTSLTKPRIPTMSTPSRPAPASQSSRSVSDTSIRLAARHGNGQIISGGGGEEKDPLSDLRKAALDVLACLRGVEERFRTTDDSADNSFEELHEEEMPGQATSVSPDRQQQQQQRSSPFKAPRSDTQPSTIPSKRIEDSEDLWFFSQRAGDSSASGEWTEEEKKGWYERLMSGEAGWTYRPDIRVGVELQEEREVVRRYLDTVVDTFFGATTGEGNEVPWRRKVMRGEDERELRLDDVGIEVEDGNEARLQQSTESEFARLPDWADSQLWEDRCIGEAFPFFNHS
ncbi:hypothetical protein QFC24_003183 [Naganishia onofrii]|uniref:Uncharacterized protein n=1 Tax=Naganishia onofrii TaxID=1851511 RepID=A0ACC2XN78_9TREE|nr:hypothetical protein QFC24_003183 [Naganishia onofrii]